VIVEHVGLAVTDLGRSIDFYTGVFGFEVLRKTPINAYLHLDEELLELMQASTTDPPAEPATSGAWQERMFSHVGLNHVGFRVDDLDAAITEIEQRGGRLVVPPFEFTPDVESVLNVDSDKLRRASRPVRGDSWRIAVFADPDGTMLELLER
jgi:catechol 2,3-dioxygenase-like lactoylglutathione lyase family enzyme